jgi:hypothetical protein
VSRPSQFARALLAGMRVKLERAAETPVRLNDAEIAYLLQVCTAALDGAADPLQIGKTAGGQRLADDGIIEARLVHAKRKQLKTLRAACEAVAKALGRGTAGEKSGAIEKNYKHHRAALQAADRLYASLKPSEGYYFAPPASVTAADIAAIVGKVRGN